MDITNLGLIDPLIKYLSIICYKRHNLCSNFGEMFANVDNVLKFSTIFIFNDLGRPKKHDFAICWVFSYMVVLKYLLGYPDVKNYDGSWTEWGNMIANPIEK
jgi:hypothetical protein